MRPNSTPAALLPVALIAVLPALVKPTVETLLPAVRRLSVLELKVVLDGAPAIVSIALAVVILVRTKATVEDKKVRIGVAFALFTALIASLVLELYRQRSLGGDLSNLHFVVRRAGPILWVGMGFQVATIAVALRLAANGHLMGAQGGPRRVKGKRAIHGEAKWMTIPEAKALFGGGGGVVVAEACRADLDSPRGQRFRAAQRESWGQGGQAPLLCFDGSFGSSHGLVFAGSGGFKTSSVTIPTCLKWGGPIVVLDPSTEVAPMVSGHRQRQGREVLSLDPKIPDCGFNVLDWVGGKESGVEEDSSTVATWIVSDSNRIAGTRDDFFQASSQQLITAIIADVCQSEPRSGPNRTLRQVRKNLAQPEPDLRAYLRKIYDTTSLGFLKEIVSAFIGMTFETFSGIHASAMKETHWLSYPAYSGLVSGRSFSIEDFATGNTDIFINIDLKTLDAHPALARVIIGSLTHVLFSGEISGKEQCLFLLDEVARLGFMRVLETARDAGRKYGISLLLLYQSIGQMRASYGGRDATSKWFESVSWISFAAINDPETAEYISKRCGMTTVEIDQTSRSLNTRGSSRTRSKQLVSRPLILPEEVLRMRADEQIIFTAGNPPLRCGRAIWFRRSEMTACIEKPGG